MYIKVIEPIRTCPPIPEGSIEDPTHSLLGTSPAQILVWYSSLALCVVGTYLLRGPAAGRGNIKLYKRTPFGGHSV